MRNTIEAFKPGRHVAMNGRAYEFSAAQVAAIAASYDPAVLAAPVVLGHPQTDDPAWAWVKGLTVDEGGLMTAEMERADPNFSAGVDAGRYRYVSCAFFSPDDAANPKPGEYYLRHLGFLGAKAPAVKGLTPAFAEGRAGTETAVEFVSDGDVIGISSYLASALRGLREWMIGKFGLDEANAAIPSWTADGAVQQAAEIRASAEEPALMYADPAASPDPVDEPTPAFAERLASLEAREAELAAREAALAEAHAETVRSALAAGRADDLAFVDGLVVEGRLPPGHRDGVLALFAHAAADEAGPSFAEGEDARGALRTLLSALGSTIAFAEVSGGADPQTGDLSIKETADAARVLVDEARSRGQTLSTADAVARVRRP